MLMVVDITPATGEGHSMTTENYELADLQANATWQRKIAQRVEMQLTFGGPAASVAGWTYGGLPFTDDHVRCIDALGDLLSLVDDSLRRGRSARGWRLGPTPSRVPSMPPGRLDQRRPVQRRRWPPMP